MARDVHAGCLGCVEQPSPVRLQFWARPVKALSLADFAWVPKAHPIGSVVQSEDGHWITFTPGKSEHRNHPPIRLSDGQYFVLGDNRDDSEDSPEFGPVS